jgi:hypothetical protein
VIVVRTSVVENGLFGDEYEAFVAALRAQGLDARVDEPDEYRSVGPAVDVGIWIGDNILQLAAAAAIVDTIRRAAKDTISKRKAGRKTQRLRRLPVYGSRGQIHGWVDLPADDEQDDSGD